MKTWRNYSSASGSFLSVYDCSVKLSSHEFMWSCIEANNGGIVDWKYVAEFFEQCSILVDTKSPFVATIPQADLDSLWTGILQYAEQNSKEANFWLPAKSESSNSRLGIGHYSAFLAAFIGLRSMFILQLYSPFGTRFGAACHSALQSGVMKPSCTNFPIIFLENLFACQGTCASLREQFFRLNIYPTS